MQTANDNRQPLKSLFDEKFIAAWNNAIMAAYSVPSKPRKIVGYTSGGNGSAIPVYGEGDNGQG